MKFTTAVAFAASLTSATPAPPSGKNDAVGLGDMFELTAEQVSDFRINTLGGMTIRAQQVANDNFITKGRGQRALLRSLRKYSAYGATVPPDLMCTVEGILQALGISGAIPGADASCAAGQTPAPATGGQAPAKGGQAPAKGGQGEESSRTNGTTKGNPPGSPARGNATQAGSGKGEVAATPQMNDVEYLAEVQIGTPPQSIMLNFDTGSSDLWVFSGDTPAIQSQGHKVYNAKASSTASRFQNATWSITYGDGSSASGIVFKDTVAVGGVTVQNQAIESATQVSGSFVDDKATSGLLGLAMDAVNQVRPTKQKTFFSNAMKNLAMPLFSANLKQGQAGNYNFGFIDQTEFTGSVNFVPVNATQGFWEFTTSAVVVGNSGTPLNMPHQAIADTGTTLMLMPEDVVAAYYAQVRSATNNALVGGFVFNCNETLPSITAVIGGYKAVVGGDIIKFAPVDGETIASSKTCFGGIQPAAGLPFAIYGDIFLKAQFTVFDGGNMRIGFAAKSGN